MNQINVNIYSIGEKTAELVCNWCGLLHKVEPKYREEVLSRAADRLAEMQIVDVLPEDTWTCGLCYLALHKIPKNLYKTECHNHEVPPKRYKS